MPVCRRAAPNVRSPRRRADAPPTVAVLQEDLDRRRQPTSRPRSSARCRPPASTCGLRSRPAARHGGQSTTLLSASMKSAGIPSSFTTTFTLEYGVSEADCGGSTRTPSGTSGTPRTTSPGRRPRRPTARHRRRADRRLRQPPLGSAAGGRAGVALNGTSPPGASRCSCTAEQGRAPRLQPDGRHRGGRRREVFRRRRWSTRRGTTRS